MQVSRLFCCVQGEGLPRCAPVAAPVATIVLCNLRERGGDACFPPFLLRAEGWIAAVRAGGRAGGRASGSASARGTCNGLSFVT